MNHFLVRIGKIKHIELVVPIINCTITTAYCLVQFKCHHYLRDIFAAQSPSGHREKISDHLRNLISETHDTCLKNGWCNFSDLGKFNLQKTPTGKIHWFASSTLEPITFGSTSLSSGLLISVPNYYNYTETGHIPDSAFEIKKLALFRSAHDKLQEERSKIQDDGIAARHEPKSIVLLRKIDRKSNEGMEYADSLILTDDAKKFSIAREMFFGDTYHSLTRAAVLFISLVLASSLGRGAVVKMNLREYHITYRFITYSLAGSFGFLNHKVLADLADQFYAKIADDKAKALGAKYEMGAEEYYTKRALRRKILGLN